MKIKFILSLLLFSSSAFAAWTVDGVTHGDAYEAVTINSGRLDTVASGLLSNSGRLDNTVSGLLSNSGRLDNVTSGLLSNSGRLDNTTSGLLVVSGRTDQAISGLLVVSGRVNTAIQTNDNRTIFLPDTNSYFGPLMVQTGVLHRRIDPIASDVEMLKPWVNKVENNLIVNSFYDSIASSLYLTQLEDGWWDDFSDTSGVQLTVCSNYVYDGVSFTKKPDVLPASAAKILCHFDGDNLSTNFTNVVNSSMLLNNIGSVFITNSYKFGTGSIVMGAHHSTYNGFTVLDSQIQELGTNAWTLEYWYYIPAQFVNYISYHSKGWDGVAGWAMGNYANKDNFNIAISTNGSDYHVQTTGVTFIPASNEWIHVCLQMFNWNTHGTFAMYTNGIRKLTGYTTNFLAAGFKNNTNDWVFGTMKGAIAETSDWYMDELRLSIGNMYPETNFTPPTDPFTGEEGGGGGGETYTNMVIVSTNFYASSQPVIVKGSLIVGIGTGENLNSNIYMRATCNGGSTWATLPLTYLVPYTGTLWIVSGTNAVSGTGTNMMWRVESYGTAIELYSASLLWR